MSLDEFNQKLEEYGERGRQGCSGHLRCMASETEAGITLTVELLDPKKTFSGADVWGIAMLEEMKRSLPEGALEGKKLTLRFIVDPNKNSNYPPQHYEEFKRRLSYLAAVNESVGFLLEKGPGQEDALSTMEQMIRLAQNEETVQHKKISPHEKKTSTDARKKIFRRFCMGTKTRRKVTTPTNAWSCLERISPPKKEPGWNASSPPGASGEKTTKITPMRIASCPRAISISSPRINMENWP